MNKRGTKNLVIVLGLIVFTTIGYFVGHYLTSLYWRQACPPVPEISVPALEFAVPVSTGCEGMPDHLYTADSILLGTIATVNLAGFGGMLLIKRRRKND